MYFRRRKSVALQKTKGIINLLINNLTTGER
jgi:hypothetical protein